MALGTEKIFYYKNEEIKYIYKKATFSQSDKLVIVFSAFSTNGAPPQYSYLRTLEGIDINQLFILDGGKRGTYYLGNAPDFDYEKGTIKLIENILTENQIEESNVMCIGSSKGGWAALYFGIKFNVQKIVVGEPQIYIGKYLVGTDVLDEICNNETSIYFDYVDNMLLNLIKDTNTLPEIIIHAGKKGDHYKYHILPIMKYLKGQVKLDLENYAEHNELIKFFPKLLLNEIFMFDERAKNSLNIQDITIEYKDDAFICQVTGNMIQSSAWYVYYNNELRDRYSYSSGTLFNYHTNELGLYRFRCFAQDDQNNKISKGTSTYIINNNEENAFNELILNKSEEILSLRDENKSLINQLDALQEISDIEKKKINELYSENKKMMELLKNIEREIEKLKADEIKLKNEYEGHDKKNGMLIFEAKENNILLMEKTKIIPELKNENFMLKEQNKNKKRELDRITKEMVIFNQQAYQYKMEYDRLINSKSIKFILSLKKIFGHPYEKKYINDNTLNLMNNEQKTFYQYDKKLLNEKYLNDIECLIDEIPQSNGCRYYKKFNVTIGIICDQFLLDSYEGSADFVYITPDNWENIIPDCKLLFVVSTWHGVHNEWQGLTNKESAKSKLLMNIIDYANSINKTTIFYSKDDPDAFDEFIHFAKKCKYIFTDEEGTIGRYKEVCENNNVFSLPFCINPLHNNPIGSGSKQTGVIFSGSWMERFPERCADQMEIFDGVINSGKKLIIVDRNYSLNNPRYVFPEKYHKYVVPNIEHNVLQKVHKLYDWSININSTKNSMTGFASRAFELQANGNLLISNYSVGMFNMLPYIFIPFSQEEVELLLKSFSPEEIAERKAFGVRFCLKDATCYDRMAYILSSIGMNSELIQRSVCVVTDKITDKIKKMFEIQTYKEKNIIEISEYNDNIHEEYDIISFFDENMQYDMFYLEDMINGFKFTNCDYITKDAYYMEDNYIKGKENSFVSIIDNKYRTVFWADSFSSGQLKNMTGSYKMPNGYSIDRFNYNAIRTMEQAAKKENNYKISVIIPTYNNGDYLYGKAFASLKRCGLFNELEIIIIDDGSTDGYTPNLIKYLSSKYANIKYFFFNDGGSGSASRPRNKGVEVATCNLITFIDPDNEVKSNAYKKMYDVMMKNDKLDFVCGNMTIVDTNEQNWNYYSYLANNKRDYCRIVEKNKFAILNGDKDILIDSNFMGIQMQAAMVKKSFLVANNLKQVERAAGEDTLFGWQWVLNAKYFGILNESMSIYYAGRSDSVVNSVNEKFFKRYLAIEEPRKELLQENNLIDTYMKNRFSSYFLNWDLKHLSLVCNEDLISAAQDVEKMFDIYSSYYLNDNEVINKFITLCKEKKYDDAVEFIRREI